MAELKTISVFLASPSDVMAERKCFRDITEDLNTWLAGPLGFCFVIRGWETAAPGFGEAGVQSRIDAETDVERCDLLVGMFWKKFGIPDASGETPTQHEINLGRKQWRLHQKPQVMLYFSQQHPHPESQEDVAQLVALMQFKSEVQAELLTVNCTDQLDFERQVRNHLTKCLLDLKRHEEGNGAPRTDLVYSVSSLPVILRKRGRSEQTGDLIVSVTRSAAFDSPLSALIDVHVYTNAHIDSLQSALLSAYDPQSGEASIPVNGALEGKERAHIVFDPFTLSFKKDEAVRTLKISGLRIDTTSCPPLVV